MQLGNISGAPQFKRNKKGQMISFVCWRNTQLSPSIPVPNDYSRNSIGMIFAFLTVVILEVLSWAIVKEKMGAV